MFTVRYYNEDDYNKIVEWWNYYKFTPPAETSLSTIGIMVSKEKENIVCGFLYVTNSDMCLVEFIVANPNVKDKEIRKEAIETCIKKLCEVAKDLKYRVAFTSLNNKSLEEKYVECGFKKGSTDCNEYIKIV